MLTAKHISRFWILLAFLVGGAGCARRDLEDQLEQARQAVRAGNEAAARDQLDRIVAAGPDDAIAAAAYNDLGVLAWRRGDVKQALEAFDESRRQDSRFAAALYNLGVISTERGNPIEAAALFEEAAALDPEDPRALEYLAGLYMQSDRWGTAATQLEQAADRAPRSPRIRTALALTRLRLDDSAGAVDELLKAVEADPGYAPAYYNLAVIHDQWLRDPRTAAHYVDKFLQTSDDEVRKREALAMKIAWGEEPGPPPPDPSLPPAAPPSAGVSLPEMPPLDVGLEDVIAPQPVEPAPAEASPEAAPSTGRDDVAAVPDPFAEERIAPQPRPLPETPTARPPQTTRAAPRPSPTIRPDRSVPIAPPPRPATITGLLNLGRRLARQGRSEEAFRAYRDASDIAAREGQSDRLELILREAVAACPSEPGAHYDYGLFLMNQGRPAEALPAFQQAVALAPNWAPPYLGMAETAVRTGQNDAAYVALTRALRLEPTNREAMWGIASLLDLQRRNLEQAIQAYREFLSRYPDDPRAERAKERITALQAESYQAPRQQRLTLFGPPRAAPSAERTSPDVSPTGAASPPPAVASAAPPPEPARLSFRRPRTRNRDAAVAAYNRGTIYQARDDWDRAIEYYLQALESDDSFALAYYNLGVAYHSIGSLDLAQQAYEASIGLQPCHVNSRFNLALLYRERGRAQDAAEQLQAALRCDSTHARTHYMLGLIYAESSRTYDLAERHFRRFLRLAPSDPAAADVRNWLRQLGA